MSVVVSTESVQECLVRIGRCLGDEVVLARRNFRELVEDCSLVSKAGESTDKQSGSDICMQFSSGFMANPLDQDDIGTLARVLHVEDLVVDFIGLVNSEGSHEVNGLFDLQCRHGVEWGKSWHLVVRQLQGTSK